MDLIQKMLNSYRDKLSAASIKKIRDIMHQMFGQAVKSQYIIVNPVEGTEVPKLGRKEKCAIPEDIIKSLEEFCKEYEHGALIMCLLYTGMRRGEMLALTVGDINIAERYITVNKAIEFIHNSPHVKTPKTPRSNRVIPILDPLVPYLEEIMTGKRKTDVLFCNCKGSHYDKSGIQILYRKFEKQFNEFLENSTEMIHFTMHQFRHTFCTMLYKAGVDVKMAQDILGHNSVSVTLDIYTHLDQASKTITTDKLNSFLRQKSVKSQSNVSC